MKKKIIVIFKTIQSDSMFAVPTPHKKEYIEYSDEKVLQKYIESKKD